MSCQAVILTGAGSEGSGAYRMVAVQARDSKLAEVLQLTVLDWPSKFGEYWTYGILVSIGLMVTQKRCSQKMLFEEITDGCKAQVESLIV